MRLWRLPMFKLHRSKARLDLVSSKLFDQDSFYPAFVADIKNATCTLIIESPFITSRRIQNLYPILKSVAEKGVKVIINTRDPVEHDVVMKHHAEEAVSNLQALGAIVLFTSNHHRKLAIIDNHILYEGSLNILSQNDSCEMMRRIDSANLSKEMIDFLKIKKHILTEQEVNRIQ